MVLPRIGTRLYLSTGLCCYARCDRKAVKSREREALRQEARRRPRSPPESPMEARVRRAQKPTAFLESRT